MSVVNADTRTEGPGRGLILAAGCVLWRVGPEGLEVLLVHRPRYDDWSWPKGKLEAGETFAQAAVREVAEETGLSARLGVPLPTARYRLGDTTDKEVRYWAAAGGPGQAPAAPMPLEVDESRWVPATDAATMLSRRGDRVQLEAVLTAHTSHTLDTWPFLVLRHGYARPRHLWAREDAERPLLEAGLAQATQLVPLLAAYAPEHLVSSPWVRCLQTMQPFAEQAGLKVRTKNKLSEHGHRRDRPGTGRLVKKCLGRSVPTLVCTHRPVLGTVLGVLAGHATAGLSADIPRRDPFLEPGEILVAHVARASGRIVAIERHQPDGRVAVRHTVRTG